MLDGPLPDWPSYSDEEAKAAARVISSGRVNYWTGEEGRLFEKEFARFADSQYAIALSNGTAALEIALHGLGVGARNGGSSEDEVIVTPRSFIASASAVIHAGAVPVFADVDRDSGNIEAQTIEPQLTGKTKAIIPVHLAGYPVRMAELMELAEAKNLKVIEDCAQAHGATIDGRSVGSFGHVSAWSFCQDKIMSTGGEGGMVTTNSEELWKRMWSFKDHGKSYAAVYERTHEPGFRWVHESFGTNARMTEVQAAIGRIQLTKMPNWTLRRNENAAVLIDALAPLVERNILRVPRPDNRFRHADYKFYAYIVPEAFNSGWDRDAIQEELVRLGVPCFQGSCSEIYRERAFADTNFCPEQTLPTAYMLGQTSLMWLVHPTIDSTAMHRVSRLSADVFAKASR